MPDLDGVTLRFSEAMSGYLGIGEGDPRRGVENGRLNNAQIRFDVEIIVPNLAKFFTRTGPYRATYRNRDIRAIGRNIPDSGWKFQPV